MAFCNKCGTSVPDNIFVCGNCSVQANASPHQPPAGVVTVSGHPARRSRLRPLIWIAAGIFAIFVVFFALAITKGVEDGVQEGVRKNIGKTGDIKEIQTVLKQDRALTEAMNRTINQTKINTADDFDKIADAIKSYLGEANRIDTQLCPRDFAEAYYRHLSAYSNEEDVLRSHPNVPTGDEAFANGFLRGLAGDPTGGVVQMQDDLKAWFEKVKDRNADVDRTWQEVQALGIRYGA